MLTPSPEICVVALIGLPAAGKTSFCKNLISSTSCPFSIIHFCFDGYFKFTSCNSHDKHTNTVSFKNVREKSLDVLKTIISSIKAGKEPSSSSFCHLNVRKSCSKGFVIIYDDNNYYTGMRNKIFQIAKYLNTSYGQIYFPIDVTEALIRNTLRGKKNVPEEVIRRMEMRFEPPHNSSWEYNNLTFTANVIDFEEVNTFFELSFKNICNEVPLTSKVNKNTLSFIHDTDIVLRRRIKDILEKTESKDKKHKAATLVEQKKTILSILRKNDADATVNCNSNIDKIINLLG